MPPKQEQESALLNPQVECHEDTDEDAESFHYVPPPRRRRCSACRCFGWTMTLLMIVLISALTGAWISMAYLEIDQTCAMHTNKWSPVLKDIAIKYKEQHFDGNFMEENKFRKNGSAEVDKAWESLGVDYRPGVISYKDGIASGLTDAHVQVNAEHGGGFIVNVEGMHHLHCLVCTSELIALRIYTNSTRTSSVRVYTSITTTIRKWADTPSRMMAKSSVYTSHIVSIPSARFSCATSILVFLDKCGTTRKSPMRSPTSTPSTLARTTTTSGSGQSHFRHPLLISFRRTSSPVRTMFLSLLHDEVHVAPGSDL
ncbi:hypothetical protein SNK05_001931 [Fusarium graminearum]